MDPSYACEAGEISTSEALHPFNEQNDSRFDRFKSALEQTINPDNLIATELNSRTNLKTSETPRYCTEKKIYEFFRIEKDVFAVPAGMLGKIEPIPMGSTPEEFLKYLKKLKKRELEPQRTY